MSNKTQERPKQVQFLKQKIIKPIKVLIKYYLSISFILLILYLYQESRINNSSLRNYIIKNWYSRQRVDSYLASSTQLYQIPDQLQIFQNESYPTPKIFFSQFISKSTPCYLEGYAKGWPAYYKWQDKNYLIDKVGHELIFVEKAPLNVNKFAYFKKEFGKEYMTYSKFIQTINNPNRSFNYYFAEETVPQPIITDLLGPQLGQDIMDLFAIKFWQGIGTVSLPHQDEKENIMCVIKGYKNFTIVSPFQSHYVYPGDSPNMPPNYSPVDFDNPDLGKYPRFKEAKVFNIKVVAGDCLYLPSFWWHQVTSSNEECIAISHWYQEHSITSRILNEFIKDIG